MKIYLYRLVHCATSPALLPYGYIIGSVDSVSVTLTDPVSALALETLVPRSVLARYLALVIINDYNIIGSNNDNNGHNNDYDNARSGSTRG